MSENYCALIYCILKNATPEDAFSKFDLIDSKLLNKQKEKSKLESIREMYQMRINGLTYNQIGDFFGMKGFSVFNKMKREKSLFKDEFDLKLIFPLRKE